MKYVSGWKDKQLLPVHHLSITLSLVSKLISVSYPNHVRLRVKCIEGVLTSHLGSNLDPYYNQNRVITNRVTKRFGCTRII